MSLLRSFCTPYGAPGRLYYDSYEFFKCSPQADLRAWRKLAVTFFAQQIQIENSLGWFLTLWATHSCKNQLVANFSPDGSVLMLIVPNYNREAFNLKPTRQLGTIRLAIYISLAIYNRDKMSIYIYMSLL